MNNLKKCSNIEELIDFGKNQYISHDKLHLKSVTNFNGGKKKVVFNYIMLLDEYKEYIAKCMKEITFTDEEFIKYKFKPKLYCWDEYETIEFWSILLRMNGMLSVMDFNKKTIKTFDKEKLENTIAEIMILEKNNIAENSNYVVKELKNNIVKRY